MTVQRNTVGRLAQSGCPLSPRGPRTNSRFSIKLLTMNMNARDYDLVHKETPLSEEFDAVVGSY
jgi:hypothetical protein